MIVRSSCADGGKHAGLANDQIAPTPDEQAVRGCKGLPLEDKERPHLTWRVERGAAPNYQLLGRVLAASGDLYRDGEHGLALLQVLPNGRPRLIAKGAALAPVIVDRVRVRVTKEGKLVSELPTSAHLNAMLRSEAFLSNFLPLDEVATHPVYMDDFTLVQPGYNDGGSGNRIFYLGPAPQVADSTEAITRFLNVMAFATNADRTNTVAAALTALLRRCWLGQKPIILVTATKSHSGKGTITDFFRGSVPKADILYEAIDWPMMNQFQRQLQVTPDIGLVVFDNVRCDSSGHATMIRSGFIESFVTNPEVVLASPGAGEAVQLQNRYLVTINTNDGKLSPDLMNRALSIHLAPHGNVHEHETPIGNPKLDYLPKYRDQIEAELRGMIERWKAAGCPLVSQVKHSMANWATTIGGILRVSGFTDFLGNSSERRSTDDPVQEALAILGARKPGKALRPREWAKLAVEEGLAKTLLPANERDTEKGRERAIGKVLKRHCEVTFLASTDTTSYRLRLDGGFRRWTPGKNPHTRYVFTVKPLWDGEPVARPCCGWPCHYTLCSA